MFNEGSGWVKLHRKLLTWQWSSSPKHVALFIHLLLRASHKKTSWRKETLLPGQLIAGRKKLSKDTGISEQSIRTVLNDLKSTNELTIKTTSQYTVITIKNWESYQESTNELTINQPATNQRSTTYKNVKNVKNVKNLYIGADLKDALQNKTELLNFLTHIIKPTKQSFEKWISENSITEIVDELENFSNYLEAKGKKYKNYCAAFNNWLKSPYRKRGGQSGKTKRSQKLGMFPSQIDWSKEQGL